MDIETTPRPTASGEDFYKKVALGLVPSVMEAISAEWDEGQKAKAAGVISSVLQKTDDGFVRAYLLREEYGWDIVNEKVVEVLRGDRVSLAHALEALEVDWVMKTGIRFPAKEGDHIDFKMDLTTPTLKGEVLGAFRKRATGIVLWTPTSGSPVKYTVPAECVTKVYPKKGDPFVPEHTYAVRVKAGEIVLSAKNALAAYERVRAEKLAEMLVVDEPDPEPDGAA